MKYKVGDKVRVRKDLKVGKKYGAAAFVGGMERFKNNIFLITSVGSNFYKLDKIWYCWTDKMLEPVEETIEYKGKKYDVVGILNNAQMYKDCGFIQVDLGLGLKEHKEEILDEAEKRYLRNVIKYVIEPTHNEIEYISKSKYEKYCWITICLKDNRVLLLPYFKDKRMYKGMELDKEYTLDQLQL